MKNYDEIKNAIKSRYSMEDCCRDHGIELKREGKHLTGKCSLPGHVDDTPSFTVYQDTNTWHCFGCKRPEKGEVADVITFYQYYYNISYQEAVNRLADKMGLALEISDKDKKLMDYIKTKKNWSLENQGFKYSLDRYHMYTDEKGVPVGVKIIYVYYKNGSRKKTATQHLIVDNGEYYQCKENAEGFSGLYNLPRVMSGINKGKPIFITEGEKDAETLIRKGYVATCHNNQSYEDEEIRNIFVGAKVYIVGDTGTTGDKHVREIIKSLRDTVAALHVVHPAGLSLEEMGDNKDITDWFEEGHTVKEFDKAVRNCLDLLDRSWFYHEAGKVYKMKSMKRDEDPAPVQITNFEILDAVSFVSSDSGKDLLEFRVKDYEFNIHTVKGNLSMFKDENAFNAALGKGKLTYYGNKKDLLQLKDWIYRYFVRREYFIHGTAGIQIINGAKGYLNETGFYTAEGVNRDHVYKPLQDSRLATMKNIEKIDPKNIDKEVISNLYNFNMPSIVTSILGYVGLSYMHTLFKEMKIAAPFLKIEGLKESGKSTTMTNVLMPLLGIEDQLYISGHMTKYSIETLASTNYTTPLILDEYKPSKMNDPQLKMFSDKMRAYWSEGGYPVVTKGDKSLNLTSYYFYSPLIIMGEQGFWNNEEALLTRCLTGVLSISKTSKENREAIEALIDNSKELYSLANILLFKALQQDREVISEKIKRYRQFYDNCGLDRRVNHTAVMFTIGFEFVEEVLNEIGARCDFDYMNVIVETIQEQLTSPSGAHEASPLNAFLENMDAIDMFNVPFRWDLESMVLSVNMKCLYDEIARYLHGMGQKPELTRNDLIKQMSNEQYFAYQNKAVRNLRYRNQQVTKKANGIFFEKIKHIDKVQELTGLTDENPFDEVAASDTGKVVNFSK